MSYGLAGVLAAGGVAVLGSPARAAPHIESAPVVAAGWTDSARPGRAFPADGRRDLPIGTRVDAAGRAHTSRVYATFDLSPFEGRKVTGGFAFFVEESAADCGRRAIEVWRTRPVTEPPTWRRAPQPLARLDGITAPDRCPGAWIGLDVGAAVRDAMNRRQKLVTFEIRVPADGEADPGLHRTLTGWHGIELEVEYNSPPVLDDASLTTAGHPCTPERPHPRHGPEVVVGARVTDPDEFDLNSLTAEFAWWPVGEPEARRSYQQWLPEPDGSFALALPAATLDDGVTYAWQARGFDGVDVTPWSRRCFFTYVAG